MRSLCVLFVGVSLASMPAFAEGEPACAPALGKIIKAADSDGNGSVTLEEYLAAFPNSNEHRFNVLDRNNDGALTKEDVPWEQRGRVLRKLKLADTDENGSVTPEEFFAEFENGTQQQFDRLDRNADGVINKDDCVRLHQPDNETID